VVGGLPTFFLCVPGARGGFDDCHGKKRWFGVLKNNTKQQKQTGGEVLTKGPHPQKNVGRGAVWPGKTAGADCLAGDAERGAVGAPTRGGAGKEIGIPRGVEGFNLRGRGQGGHCKQ